MGHYLSELWSPSDDPQLRSNYERRSKEEIWKTCEKNPIKLEDLHIGDKVRIWDELKKIESKVYYEGENKFKDVLRERLYLVLDNSTLTFLRLFEDVLKTPMKVTGIENEFIQFSDTKNMFHRDIGANYRLLEKVVKSP